MKKIDWPNHIIAFLSALLGILIAFRLQYYRENQQERQQLDKAMIVIKEELENNLNIYRTNSEQLCRWVDYYHAVADTLGSGDDLEIDVVPVSGISMNGWESAVNSGIITKMEHSKVFALTTIYYWIERDLGVSDEEMIEDRFDGGYDKLDVIVEYYDRTCKVHRLKYEEIMPLFESIAW